jgi:type IV secretion system protein VirB9
MVTRSRSFRSLAASLIATAIILSPYKAPIAKAQTVPSAEDSRIALLHYTAGAPANLRLVAGVDLTVLLPRGEHVERVTVDDPSALRVTVPGEHDGIVISALRPLRDASLVIDTAGQSYRFSVTVELQGSTPWMVRIARGVAANNSGGMFPQFPINVPAGNATTAHMDLPPGTWKLRGDKALVPADIHDDGAKVSIRWLDTQAIPAVFALDERGKEQMVNGYMRGDAFVIDRVFEHLVFRIDKAVAHADRGAPEEEADEQ